MYLAVATAVSKASVFSIGLECATGTCSHSHSHSRSALPKYFITSPWSRCSLFLFLSFATPLYLYLSSLFCPLAPFLFHKRKKLFAVMSSCKARLIVVTIFLNITVTFVQITKTTTRIIVLGILAIFIPTIQNKKYILYLSEQFQLSFIAEAKFTQKFLFSENFNENPKIQSNRYIIDKNDKYSGTCSGRCTERVEKPFRSIE